MLPHGSGTLGSSCCESDKNTVRDSARLRTVTNTRVGKFDILQCLGTGGQSTVFKALDPDLRRVVALKIYHAADNPECSERVLAEGRAIASIDSPYVARCHTTETLADRVPVLVMEWVNGDPLDKYVENHSLSFSEIRELVAKIALGVAAIHERGLVHFDLKPSNIMVDANGNPTIIDFGLVQPISESQTAVAGTYAYMAPEVARGDGGLNGRAADIFGLGGILYFLLNGRPVRNAATKSKVRALAQDRTTVVFSKSGPSDLAECCRRCLDPDPSRRFPSARAAARSIRPGPRCLRAVCLVALLLAALTTGLRGDRNSVGNSGKLAAIRLADPSRVRVGIRTARDHNVLAINRQRTGRHNEALSLIADAATIRENTPHTDGTSLLWFDYYFTLADFHLRTLNYGAAGEALRHGRKFEHEVRRKRPARVAEAGYRAAHVARMLYGTKCLRADDPTYDFAKERARILRQLRRVRTFALDVLQQPNLAANTIKRLELVVANIETALDDMGESYQTL